MPVYALLSSWNPGSWWTAEGVRPGARVLSTGVLVGAVLLHWRGQGHLQYPPREDTVTVARILPKHE